MGQCYGEVNQSKQNVGHEANTTTYVVTGDGNQIQPLTPPAYGRAKNTPARSSNPSPLYHMPPFVPELCARQMLSQVYQCRVGRFCCLPGSFTKE